MALTFLFVDDLDDTGCMSIVLDTDGRVDAELAHRSYDEIKSLQVGSQTMIVLSAARCGFHQVELPWLSDSKARAAIPYALEEQLAQKLPMLHFAFDREHHQHHQYLVVVIDKVWLADLMARLDAAEIEYHEITVDWFALNPGDICMTPTTILMNVARYQGALSFDVARTYLNTVTDAASILTFTDSSPDINPALTTPLDSPFLLWVAKRLQQTARMNLCQGEFRRVRQQEGFGRRWALISVMLGVTWFLTVLSVNTINLIRLNHQNSLLDQQIAVIYRQFFPEAQQIISPRFRISQLLGIGQMTQRTTLLWLLLDKLDKVVSPKETVIEGLGYRNNTLSVALKSKDFKALESLGERLKQEQVKISQTQAVSHEHDVTAVMELRL